MQHQQQQKKCVSIQSNLNNLVMLIKQKQQISFQIINHIQILYNNRQQLQNLVYVQDQITKHNLLLSKFKSKFQQDYQMFYTIVKSQINSNQPNKVLLRRVAARVLEIFNNYVQKVDKCNQFQKQISNHFKQRKFKFIKHIQSIDKSFTPNILSILFLPFFDYLKDKFDTQCKKLQAIIDLIENGQVSKIQQILQCKHCKSIQQKEDLLKKGHNSQKYLQKQKFSQQKQRITKNLQLLRQQSKQKQLIRKKKLKFINKYYSLFTNAMDLNKHNFIQQFSIVQKQQNNSMHNQLINKNKINQNFINEWYQKVSNIRLNGFQNVLHKINFHSQSQGNIHFNQSQGNRDVNKSKDCMLQPQNQTFKTQNYSIKRGMIQRSNLVQTIKQALQVKTFRITANILKKPLILSPKSNPNLLSRPQQLSFVKINLKTTSIINHRGRLPDISSRMFSTQQKRKQIKVHEQGNNQMILRSKTIQIKDQPKKSKDNSIKRVVSGKKLIINKNKALQLKMLQVNYSTSVSKKLSKFCQAVMNKQHN